MRGLVASLSLGLWTASAFAQTVPNIGAAGNRAWATITLPSNTTTHVYIERQRGGDQDATSAEFQIQDAGTGTFGTMFSIDVDGGKGGAQEIGPANSVEFPIKTNNQQKIIRVVIIGRHDDMIFGADQVGVNPPGNSDPACHRFIFNGKNVPSQANTLVTFCSY